MGDLICLAGKVVVEICLVPESRDLDDERIKKEIKESLKCDWLAEVEKITMAK